MDNMTSEDIKAAWMRVFPASYCNTSVLNLNGSGDLYFVGYIQTQAEWANGISNNDPLQYRAYFVPAQKRWEEYNGVGLTVKPMERFMAYGNASLRTKNQKNATLASITKRFEQIKTHILDNRQNWAHDLSGKV